MRRRFASVCIWLVLLALAAVVAGRARYTADLSAFLPHAPSPTQQLLVDQLRDGLVSRTLLVDIEGADAASRAAISRLVAITLRRGPLFRSVLNGDSTGLDRDRSFVFSHRYMLSNLVTPERFTRKGLRAAIVDGLDTLASPIGLLAKDLFVRDPTGETLQVLEQLTFASGQPHRVDGVWTSADQRRALLIAETRARGSDIDGQAQAIDAVRAAFADAQGALPVRPDPPAIVRMTGPGYFAVSSRAAIERNAVLLSIVSSTLIVAFLLFVYRSLPVLLFGLLPVISGALAGVAAVALGFGVVHGVTLGFGITLIGEAVDYSVYFFIQAGSGKVQDARAPWTATLWPTIRLGMLTSICGFASLLPSAFPGLAQLGLYSIAGLIAAGLVTRFVLPGLLPSNLRFAAPVPLGLRIGRVLTPIQRLKPLLWLLALAAVAVLVIARDRLWNRDLSALSPVPAAEQALDAELRADLGAPDVRTLVVVAGPNSEAVLEAAERIGRALEPLVAAGVIGGYLSPGQYLPSLATQRLRRMSLPPAATLAAELRAAVATLPVSAERLRPFAADVEAARLGGLVSRPDLEGTSLASAVDALLAPHGDAWTAIISLQAVRTGAGALAINADKVERAVRAAGMHNVNATVLDLKRESDTLYHGYLSEALHLSVAGLIAIVLLLLVSLRSVMRVARVVAPLLLAVLMVMAGFALAGQRLTILHLIGLLLTVAIGSNYALFFDRRAATLEVEIHARTLASLLVANLSTVIAFATLSFATVPVLSALGATVAPGAFLALFFSAVLARPNAGVSRST